MEEQTNVIVQEQEKEPVTAQKAEKKGKEKKVKKEKKENKPLD